MHPRATIVLLATFALAGVTDSNAGENTLAWKSFDTALVEAQKTKKKILIDVYTDWCGWCKRMDKQTYSDRAVANYLTECYVIVKLNAESDAKLTYGNRQYTERELAAAFGVDGYPSTIFLSSDGEPITIYPGFAEPEHFLQVLSFIAEDHYLTTTFQDYTSKKK
ncbi:MAG TPA: DUF255 domain-containing protein [Bacteroidota bacterium]|nr:DUF255 domain-containing protein [Bacteroidota bacterium]